jgi:hypothetical protein
VVALGYLWGELRSRVLLRGRPRLLSRQDVVPSRIRVYRFRMRTAR